jgi:hypothetical protein
LPVDVLRVGLGTQYGTSWRLSTVFPRSWRAWFREVHRYRMTCEERHVGRREDGWPDGRPQGDNPQRNVEDASVQGATPIIVRLDIVGKMLMNEEERLRQVCVRLAGFRGNDQNTTGPIGYLIGAAYALLQAHRLGYLYGDINDRAYANELRAVANALAEGQSATLVSGQRALGERSDLSLPGSWLAGFYFNSALHRLAAAAERLGIGGKRGKIAEPPLITQVRREVNRLKHCMSDEPRQESRGLLPGRRVTTLPMAVDALCSLLDLCASRGIVDNGPTDPAAATGLDASVL